MENHIPCWRDGDASILLKWFWLNLINRNLISRSIQIDTFKSLKMTCMIVNGCPRPFSVKCLQNIIHVNPQLIDVSFLWDTINLYMYVCICIYVCTYIDIGIDKHTHIKYISALLWQIQMKCIGPICSSYNRLQFEVVGIFLIDELCVSQLIYTNIRYANMCI